MRLPQRAPHPRADLSRATHRQCDAAVCKGPSSRSQGRSTSVPQTAAVPNRRRSTHTQPRTQMPQPNEGVGAAAVDLLVYRDIPLGGLTRSMPTSAKTFKTFCIIWQLNHALSIISLILVNAGRNIPKTRQNYADGGLETHRLQPRRPAAVRCSAWLGHDVVITQTLRAAIWLL